MPNKKKEITGLLVADRQRYAEGKRVNLADLTEEELRELREVSKSGYTKEIRVKPFDNKKDFEELNKILDNLPDDSPERGTVELDSGRLMGYQLITVKGKEKRIFNPVSLEDKTGLRPASHSRYGFKGGGLLSSDRQQYAKGDEAEERPIANYGNPPYEGGRDYTSIEFEDLGADPPVELKDQVERQDSLITNINSFVQDTAVLARDPGYSKVPSRWNILDTSSYRQGISPLEDRVNSAWRRISDEARRNNIPIRDLPADSSKGLQELIERMAIEMNEREKTEREQKQEGGLLGEDPMEQSIPMDTPPMVPKEPMVPEEPMVPDEQMEDNYLEFVISESLEDSEEVYLMDKLESDPQLSIIFDKIMNTATEFAGSGPVEGPGSAVSDSIPARLSDGEFVLTSKATDEIGPDNIQAMMKDAEARSDQRQIAQEGGVIREDLENLEDTDAIKKGMLSVNPRMRTG